MLEQKECMILMLKEYLKENYIKRQGRDYQYRFFDMFNDYLTVLVDFEEHSIGGPYDTYNYESEQQAINILHNIESQYLKYTSQALDTISPIKEKPLDDWIIKYNDFEYFYESKVLSKAGEVISLSFFKKDDGNLGVNCKYYNEHYRGAKILDLPFTYICKGAFVEEILAFMGWHIKQNKKSIIADDYFDFKLNLVKYKNITFAELKKRNLVNLMLKEPHLHIYKKNHLEIPLLYYSNHSFIFNEFSLNESTITIIIDEILEGKSAVDDIHFFDGCPYFKE